MWSCWQDLVLCFYREQRAGSRTRQVRVGAIKFSDHLSMTMPTKFCYATHC